MTTAFGPFAVTDPEETQQQVQQQVQQQQVQQQQVQQQQLQQGQSSGSLAPQKKKKQQQQDLKQRRKSIVGSSLPHPQPRAEPARDILKLYDEALRQNRETNADDASDLSHAHADDRFDVSKAKHILDIQTEIDALHKLSPEGVKIRKPKRSIACSNEVLLAALKRWQPTVKEWSNLAKHLCNIRSGIRRQNDLRKMKFIRTQESAKSISSSQPPVSDAFAGVPGSSNGSQPVHNSALNGNVYSPFQAVLAQRPELVPIFNLAILEALVVHTLSGRFELSDQQCASLSSALTYYITGNAHALSCLRESSLASNAIRRIPISHVCAAITMYSFKDMFVSAMLVALAHVTQEHYYQQLNEDPLGQQILNVKKMAETIGKEIVDTLPLLAEMDVFYQFFSAIPQHIPSIWQEVGDILGKMNGSQHHYNECHDCDFIVQDGRASPFLKCLLLRKHLIGFFQQGRYAFHDFPCALMPLLSNSTDKISPSLQIVRKPFKHFFVKTPSDNYFLILYHGQQRNFDRPDDALFHAIQAVQVSNDFAASCLKVDAFTALQELVQRPPEGVAIRPENVVFAYYGSLGAAVEFFNIACNAGLLSDQTTFYQFDLNSDSRPNENVFSLEGQKMPFCFANLFRLRLRHEVKCHDQDPVLLNREVSFVERTFQLLGNIDPESRFQLSVEIQPLEFRPYLRDIITPQIISRSRHHLRLRGLGWISPECIQRIGDHERELFSLNLSHNDLSPVEQDLQQLLKHWRDHGGGPKKEINLDFCNLSEKATVDLLFDLGSRPESTLQTLSLNGNPRNIANALFRQLHWFVGGSGESVSIMHKSTSLRYMFANGSLQPDDAHYLCQMARQNAILGNLTIQDKPEGHFRNTGVLIHDGTDLAFKETFITV